MNARVATATRLGFREQARRPLLLVLLVVCPDELVSSPPQPQATRERAEARRQTFVEANVWAVMKSSFCREG